MRSIGFLALLALFASTSTAQYDFYALNSFTSVNLNAVHFVNKDRGWVCGDNGTVWRTIDGGLNWDDQTIGTASAVNFHDIEFADPLIGFVVGESGLIYRTINGGDWWIPVLLADTDFIFENVDVTPSGDIWAVGTDITAADEVIYKSTDGGANFDPLTYGYMNYDWYGIDFLDENNGIICGQDSIFYTNDGGVNWTSASVPGAPVPHAWEDVHMVPGLSFSGAWDNYGWSSTDNGANWFVLGSGTSAESYRDVEFFDTDNGIFVGTEGVKYINTADVMYTTDDLGLTVLDTMEGVSVVDDLIAYVVGDDGRVFKSPYPENDVILESFDTPTDICGTGQIPIFVTVKNQGVWPLDSGDVNVYDAAAGLLLETTWTGILAPGESVELFLGFLSFSASETITVQGFGDTITSNNIVNIDINWQPATDMGALSPVELCEDQLGQPVTLYAYGGTEYSWIELAGPDSALAEPTVIPTGNITYNVGILGTDCVGSFPVEIIYDNCDEPITPNPTAISPNGDFMNDFFFIEELDSTVQTDMYIYDRWGTEVNAVYGYDNEAIVWKGDDWNGYVLNAGTYFYIILEDDQRRPGRNGEGWVQVFTEP